MDVNQVDSLFDWHCYIQYADVGEISLQWEIDYHGETY